MCFPAAAVLLLLLLLLLHASCSLGSSGMSIRCAFHCPTRILPLPLPLPLPSLFTLQYHFSSLGRARDSVSIITIITVVITIVIIQLGSSGCK